MRQTSGLLAAMLLVVGACDSDGPQAPETMGWSPPAILMWGSNSCPDCLRRQPIDTELVLIDEAVMYHVSGSCLDEALGEGAYEWLQFTVYTNGIGIDEDVYNRPEWNYARGYYVPQSIRYQYENYPIYLAQQIVWSDNNMEQMAITLIHETAHEFGYTEDDEGLAEALGELCSY